MSKELLVATNADGKQTKYLLEVFEEEEHWTSTLARFDESGELAAGKVAPRFYGTTREQARRRMITVLENQYESVLSIGEPSAGASARRRQRQ